jgi:predicted nuclease of predicted toxin-antitoxin system
MRLLFDQNISFRIIKKINNYYPDCKHVSDCGLIDCDDSEIWQYGRTHGYSIVTFDSDFYDISVISGHPPKIIWIRKGNLTTDEIVELLKRNREIIESFMGSDDLKEASCLEID